MTLTFGARLRLQREQKAIALSAIAADTKIKLSLLEALERDDVANWPVGIFRRAYLRSYAQAIGLDPMAVVREFLELYPDPSEVTPAEGEADTANQPSPNRLRRLVTSAMAAVPALQHAQRREATASTGRPPAPPVARQDAVSRGTVPTEADLPANAEPAVGAAANPPNPVPDVAAVPQDLLLEDRSDARLSAAADLCTRLAQVVDRRELAAVLEDAARILDAVGLIIWSWDHRGSALRPWLAHGYSDAVLARLPIVRADADNAIAAAFRSAEPCTVNGDDDVTGAAVIPLMGPGGCVGVLALELRNGGERRESVRALATILAAQLVTLLGSAPMAEAASA